MSKQEIFDKFIEIMGEFAQIRAVAALRDGFIMTTPFTICGSVFLLLAIRFTIGCVLLSLVCVKK